MGEHRTSYPCRECKHDKGKCVGRQSKEKWKPPYNGGDILYVRETWNGDWCDHYIYKADGGSAVAAGYASEPNWHPSIHMPKEAARIFLRVTGVRVERLQEITAHECICEGVDSGDVLMNTPDNDFANYAKERFLRLWDSTIKPADIAAYGFDANPWVWVVEFERCEKPWEETE